MVSKSISTLTVGMLATFTATGAHGQTSLCPPGSTAIFDPVTGAFIRCSGATGPSSSGYAGIYATEPHYGSPNSLPQEAVNSALDLASIQPEGADVFTPEGDADTVGGALTYFDAGDQTGQRYEARYQHARRIGEGTRARFLLDVPLQILHADTLKSGGAILSNSGTAFLGTVSGGVEFPVTSNWLVTPRVAYGNLQSGNDYANDGELVTGSVTSRYKVPAVGRGDLVLGNMVAYSHTINTFLSKQPFYGETDFWTLRQGLAYQLPLKRRFFGRQSSIRASYVFTYTTGTPGLAFKQLHELGVSIGVRTREAEQKNRFEQIRVGLLYSHAINEFTSKANYDSVTLTLGYRF